EFEHLWNVAYRATMGVLTTSARNNVADDAASKAVYEYWRKVDRGEVVDNPEGLVATIAKRRASDAMDRWKRDRHLRFAEEGEDLQATGMDMFVIAPGVEASDLVEFSSLEIARVVEAAALAGGDEMDVEIALGLYLRGR